MRADFRARGLAHVRQFRWDRMAALLADQLELLVSEARSGVYNRFLGEWRRLRGIQAAVDYRK